MEYIGSVSTTLRRGARIVCLDDCKAANADTESCSSFFDHVQRSQISSSGAKKMRNIITPVPTNTVNFVYGAGIYDER